MTCGNDDALGAYVLSALGPDETASIQAHLADCASCRDEAASLSSVVSMLHLVTADDIDQWQRADATGSRHNPRPGPLGGETTSAGIQRRIRHRRHRLQAAVIGAVTVITTAAVTTAATHTRPDTMTVYGADSNTHDIADVTITGHAWGSQLEMKFSGAYPAGRCSLIAHSRDGRSETAATWTANPLATLDLLGATSITVPDLTELDVVSVSGEQLVRLSIPNHNN